MAIRSVETLPEDVGQRLDRLICARLPELSRSRARNLIKQGQVRLSEHAVIEPDYRVKADDIFAVEIPEAAPADPEGEDIPLAVLFEDDALIVIDKPAGLVVHPAAGHWSGTLVNALIAHCGDSLSGIGGVKRPGIVHRLDKDTSGVMVVAKTDAAHKGLAVQFADHGREGGLHRQYLALVWGRPYPPKGLIETHIGRHATNRLKMAVTENAGKPAITTYNLKESYSLESSRSPKAVASLVECVLKTGRTHQIRVHLTHLGHPVIGDALYGVGFRSKTRALPEALRSAIMLVSRQALHAASLGFHHPTTGKYMQFKSELPADLRELARVLRTMNEKM